MICTRRAKSRWTVVLRAEEGLAGSAMTPALAQRIRSSNLWTVAGVSAASGSRARHSLVGAADPARPAARRVGHRHGRAGGRVNATRRSIFRSGCSASRFSCCRCCRRFIGRRRQPGQPDGGMALRSADRRVRHAAGHGASRRSGAHERPHGGARFRSRHDRPAAVDLDGFHRRRAGRDGRRHGVGGRARRATHGGRRSCSPARGSRRTGCCARAPSGATATPRKCAPRSAMPTTPTGWRWIRRPARNCGCSVWPTGRSNAFVARRTRLHELQYAGDAACARRPVHLEPAAGRRARTSSCSGRWRAAAAGRRHHARRGS